MIETPKTVHAQRSNENERAIETEPRAAIEPSPEGSAEKRPPVAVEKNSVKHKPKRKNNVRKLRTERMMSKAELARRAGLSTLTVDRVEKGMTCRMDTKRKILEALGLTPSDRVTVFGDDD